MGRTTQSIHYTDGSIASVTVEGLNLDALNAATFEVVRMAIKDGQRPPRWWEWWKPKWPRHCVTEYQRQMASQ